MSPPARLPRKPEARTLKVEDLVETVRRGQVRIPRFQRGLRWTADDVVKLFDSIYRGYPIGSLLFYKRLAKADRLMVGPVAVEAPETSEAWWVVDGQQRVTALTACLLRSSPLPVRPNRQDPHVLYFDAVRQKLEAPSSSGVVPSNWVPLPQLYEASQLTEWVYGWEHRANEELRRVVFEAGARIREYPIPLYLIETGDAKVAEEIYYRVNQSGHPLQWTDVHKALFGGEGRVPSTLEELAADLASVGMGDLEKRRLLTCLLALRGLDPTRTLGEHYDKDSLALSNAVSEALPVLRRALSFLRTDAGIPHLRLMPKSILLDVLTRFFWRHEEPSPRTRILLSRWFWRVLLGAAKVDDRTLRRRGIRAVGEDEEESVQKLLALVHKEKPRPLDLPEAFDARADESRIALLALAHLRPRHLATGAPIDVVSLLSQDDTEAFVRILSPTQKVKIRGARSAANRALHPRGLRIHNALRQRISDYGTDDPVLSSHAIEPRAAELLASGDLEGFLTKRSATLKAEMRRFGERMAAWDHSDRPSIDYLLAEATV